MDVMSSWGRGAEGRQGDPPRAQGHRPRPNGHRPEGTRSPDTFQHGVSRLAIRISDGGPLPALLLRPLLGTVATVAHGAAGAQGAVA
eukprot:5228710-Pyramimonas_sp.AAC.1